MWLDSYSQQEIAEAVGYNQQSVAEFVKSLQDTKNATAGENGNSSETDPLTEMEFDEEEESDGNSLGTYKLDKPQSRYERSGAWGSC